MDDYTFQLDSDFGGYISSKDRTNLKSGILVRGSQNVYKKRSGTIASRPGIMRRGTADSTDAGVVAEFVYNTSQGRTLPIRVQNNKLQVESTIVNGSTYVWYDLLESSTLLSPALSLTRFVFSTWWEANEQKDRAVMVRGDGNTLHWSGGIAIFSSSGVSGTGGLSGASIGVAGTGYTVGNILTVNGGTNAQVKVLKVSSGVVTGIEVYRRGSGLTGANIGNSYSCSGGTGTSFQATIDAIADYSIITKQGSDSWTDLGFSSYLYADKRIIINGVEFFYTHGEGTTTLEGVVGSTASLTNGMVVIQSVIVQTLVDEIPDTDFTADWVVFVGNQACYGSYTSKVIHIATDSSSGGRLGFSDLLNPADDLVVGEADFAVLDDVTNGGIVRNGKLYVSTGSSDWYEITPNDVPPIAIPLYHNVPTSSSAYVITTVKKRKGTGLSGLLTHELSCVWGDNIYYISKDNQLRVVGTFTQIEGTNFPIVSQNVYDEFQEEDFTGGHIKSSGDTIYITAPISGRHWMYQIREDVDKNGQITAERLWQSPQVSGISRFSEIDGVLFGHSNAHPQLYQIWDTNQYHDDDPSGEEVSYTCIARFSYGHTLGSKGGVDRVALNKFDKVYYEGYLSMGSLIYGKVYFDYKGATDIQDVEINTIEKPAKFFLGQQVTGIGTESLGSNPLGDGIVEEANDQATLSKFRTICNVTPKDNFEYELEVFSVDVNSRWELLCLGVNITPTDTNPTFLTK